jgi:putative phosphoesterase
MRIAVLSDIHDHVWNLALALESIAACETLICCGDLCSPFIVDQLARGFSQPIHVVFGNNDADTFRMTAKAPKYPNVHLRGEYFEEEWGGRKIAVNHFDNIARAIAKAEAHDAVFFGHNHVFELTHYGKTLAANPGSIMGCQFDASAQRTDVEPTFLIYDTTAGSTESFVIRHGAVHSK